MYSNLKNVQIIVSLLKKNGIRHIVISAGTRHTPLVCSVENDDFFKTYSVVDERSAAFFAIGIIEEIREPVAVCCTSGTAAANYVSAANEAFYQQLPLLMLTAERNHYYLFQQEEQMIPQEGLYRDVCKKVVTLPHVRDDKDFWYCSRLCNEALLELTTGEKGPVHINFFVENDYPEHQGIVKFDAEDLPDVRRIERLTLESNPDTWQVKAAELANAKILIVYGQKSLPSQDEVDAIEDFCVKYNCVISTDLLSNLHGKYCIPTFALCRKLNWQEIQELCPDILITMNANSVTGIKGCVMFLKDKFKHWHVSEKGEVSDPFKILPDVIACSPQTFFRRFADLTSQAHSEHSYFEQWNAHYLSYGKSGNLNEEDIQYSAMYAVQQYMKNIPENALFHIANSNSIRLANYFNLKPTVSVYCNRGANGIDGSMSSFIGQAHVSGKLSFLLIGDLSFFYDMNALWNKYVGNNVRILVCNNSGGAIFYSYPGKTNIPSLEKHIAAGHTASIKGWVESRGFKYLRAEDKESFDSNLNILMQENSDAPVVMEVFTDKEIDAECVAQILKPYQNEVVIPEEPGARTISHMIGKHLPPSAKKIIKKIIDKE